MAQCLLSSATLGPSDHCKNAESRPSTSSPPASTSDVEIARETSRAAAHVADAVVNSDVDRALSTPCSAPRRATSSRCAPCYIGVLC